ncbi:MAG: hypothetical protein ABFD08_16900 [Syntrophomonas sp.]
MNTPTILIYLEMVANSDLSINLAMHVTVLAALAAVLMIKGEWAKRYLFHFSIWMLFTSVTIRAITFGNPFHAVTFGVLGVLAFMHLVLNNMEIEPSGNKVQTAVALFFILIGLWYPEFVHKNLGAMLLYSPMGVIPCPTLLATLGLMTLVYRGSGKLLYGTTIIIGFVYGIIGTFVLGVYLDAALLILSLYAAYVYFTATPGNNLDAIRVRLR